MTELDPPRVLVCGSRRWPWPDTVTQVLDSLLERHGEQLVIIEGAATGADRAAHRWCEHRRLPAWRHRCYPVAWAAERRRRPRSWQWAGPERNQRMLLAEEPCLVIAFHEDFTPTTGGTSDTCLRALLLASRSGSPRPQNPEPACGCTWSTSRPPARRSCAHNWPAPASSPVSQMRAPSPTGALRQPAHPTRPPEKHT